MSNTNRLFCACIPCPLHNTHRPELCVSLIISKINSHVALRQRCHVTASNLLASYVTVGDLRVHLKVALR